MNQEKPIGFLSLSIVALAIRMRLGYIKKEIKYAGKRMIKESIYPEDSQQTRGFCAPAIKIDLGNSELIFVSGQQIAKNENNEAITDEVVEQTEYIFQQLEKILNSAGSSLDDVVKAQIFLTNINDFTKVSAIRDKYFAKSKPVSTLVEVSAMTRKGAKVEIEVTAVKKK